MNKLLKYITDSKKQIFFVSPHLDDAVYSAGYLISKVTKTNPVTVINVFSKGRRENSFSAISFLKQCNYKDSLCFYADRVAEDKQVLQNLGVKGLYLNFTDALWRRKANKKTFLVEQALVYPTFRFHIKKGQISKHDENLVAEITKKLEKIIPKNGIVFAPMALGSHVDHVIVNQICNNLNRDIIFWEDYPYNQHSKTNTNLPGFTIDIDQKIKMGLIRGYKSQFKAMFNNNIKLRSEKFYSPINKLRPTIGISIPAINEGKNIGKLLSSLIKQRPSTATIEKITVFSDGSTDDTNSIVKQLSKNNPYIKLIESEKRKGVSYGQNVLFKDCKSDILVELNADIVIKDPDFVDKLVAPIISDRADMTSAAISPLTPRSWLEKSIIFSVKLKEKLFSHLDNVNNIFTCHGPVRAYSKPLYKKIKFKYDIGEDAYSYLFAIKNGFRYLYVPETQIFFRSPSTFKDHFNQSLRFFNMRETLEKQISKGLVSSELKITPKTYLKTLLKELPFIVVNSLEMITYIMVSATCFTLSKFTHTTSDRWTAVESSKNLN